jgi:phosphoribosylanthranilate isomerase
MLCGKPENAYAQGRTHEGILGGSSVKSKRDPGVHVKICGITTPDDARAAAEAGAHAIGLNFVGGPRQITPDQASEILELLPPMVTPVALVRLEGGRLSDPLVELLAQHWVSHLQLYGELTAGSLAVLIRDGFRPMPVVPVRDNAFAQTAVTWMSGPSAIRPVAIVLDAYDPDAEGGTGRTFRWDWVNEARAAGQLDRWPSIFLAGGLKPGNVGEAIRAVRPYGVDVSSGVELEGKPGRKDSEKLRRFVAEAMMAAAA